MEIEQLEIRDYLAQISPLDKLDGETLDQIALALEIAYVRRGGEILKVGEKNHWLYLVRTGAAEIVDADGNLVDQADEGEWFGYRSVLHGGNVTLGVKALEDSLLYLLPGELMRELAEQHRSVAGFFLRDKPERLRHAMADMRDSNDSALIATRVQDLAHGVPQMVDKSTSIRAAAQHMKEATVTAMLVMDNDELAGIITDRAFCTKVAANAMDLSLPVADIMTPDPITVSSHTPGSEALLIMARHNVRHLPVVEDGKVVSMITATDLIRRQSHNAIYLINEIYRADTVDELCQLSQQLPNTLCSLVRSSMTAYDIGHAISSIGEAINKRLINMAQQKLGEAPVPYAWIVAGSLARNEQTAHSDQDSALILSDDYDENTHGQYFEDMARFVSDGLNRCGYVYCPGDVMATNPKWRQPYSVWRGYFDSWIGKPEPKALMYASIFFDLRCIHGDEALLTKLQKRVAKKSRKNTIFLSYMAANALHYRPPLGLFRKFVLEKTGAEEKALNMKRRGVVPITDLARVYALSAGVRRLHTQDRLQAASEGGKLSVEGMKDLRDAFEFIASVRLQHQALQIEQGQKPDNYVPPEELSSLEKRHLKDAFEVVRTMQEAMAVRYQTGRLG